MHYLLDTHALIWFLVGDQNRFSAKTLALLLDERNTLYFSRASIWEIAIKFGLQKPDFPYSPEIVAKELLAVGFKEVHIELKHTFALAQLPLIHRDPFDRLLICQAEAENLYFLTADQSILQYPKPFILSLC